MAESAPILYARSIAYVSPLIGWDFESKGTAPVVCGASPLYTATGISYYFFFLFFYSLAMCQVSRESRGVDGVTRNFLSPVTEEMERERERGRSGEREKGKRLDEEEVSHIDGSCSVQQ